MFSLISSLLVLMTALPTQANTIYADFNDQEKVFVIQEQAFNDFAHLTLPATDVILEKGGIPAIQSIYGLEVRVNSSEINEEGDVIVTLIRVDGGKFFYSHETLKANLTKALEAQELEIVSPASM